MEINVLKQDQQQLAKMASAAGYPDLESYLADYVHSHAKDVAELDSVYKPTEDELRDSVERLKRSHAQIAEGRHRDAGDALRGIADQLGVPFNR